MQFPAMRRLSIATAHAFLLVYATTSAPSFGCVKQCFEEIREQREDYQVNYYYKFIINLSHAICNISPRELPSVKIKIENWNLYSENCIVCHWTCFQAMKKRNINLVLMKSKFEFEFSSCTNLNMRIYIEDVKIAAFDVHCYGPNCEPK